MRADEKHPFCETVDKIARRKLGQSDDFRCYKFTRVGDAMVVVGGVPRILSRGRMKGHLIWDKSPVKLECVVTDEEFRAEIAKK